jgi:hypothetical protein
MKMFLLISQNLFLKTLRGCRGRDCMVVDCEESHLMLDTGSAFWLLLGHL